MILFLNEMRKVRRADISISELAKDGELVNDLGDIRLIDLYRYNPDDFKAIRHKLPYHSRSFSIVDWDKEKMAKKNLRDLENKCVAYVFIGDELKGDLMKVAEQMIPEKYHGSDLEGKAIVLGRFAALDFMDQMLRNYPELSEKYVPSL